MNLEKMLEKLKAQLNARGVRAVRSLGRAFRVMQGPGGSGARKIDAGEFFYGLRDFGCNFSKEESMQLMKYLDRNGDGTIDYDQFLIAVRGRPSTRRQLVIDKAYLKFDKNCDGRITAADLKGVYNASLNPKVQSREVTEEQVFLEFLQNFGDVNKDGTVSRQEWNDYYAAVSSSIDNEDHFILLMKMAWKLD